MLLDEALLRDLLTRLLANGGDFADVFVQKTLLSRVSREGRRTTVNRGEALGAGLRVVRDGVPQFASVSGLAPDALLSAADELAGCGGAGGRKVPSSFARSGARSRARAHVAREASAAERTAILLAAEEAAFAQDPRIVSFSAICRDSTGEVLVANSDGVLASEARDHGTLYIEASASSMDKGRRGARVLSGDARFDPSQGGAHLEAAREASCIAVQRLEASAVPRGVFPVVLGPRAAGHIVHEAVGRGMESDNVLEGRSPFAGRVGEVVAAPSISLAEGTFQREGAGDGAFDDEGTPIRRTELIRDGRLVGFLSDRLGARTLGISPSGHGRRESYRHPPMPRMRHIILGHGDDQQQDLVGSVGFGLLVLQVGGGGVDLPGGDFAFRISEGYLIREGRVAEPVAEAALIGNAPELLRTIDGIGGDTGEVWGTCMKAGQSVPVRDSAPSIRLPRLEVTGGGAWPARPW